jgi:hypothetical protein
MRTTFVSLVIVLAQWGSPVFAQGPPGLTTPQPTAKRFFFVSAPRIGGTVFGGPSQAPTLSRPFSLVNRAPRQPIQPTLRFTPTSLRLPESQPRQDLWRFLKPKNTRLFFFTKP